MPSTQFAYRATIGLIWALALWHSWVCRGLFVDGSAFLVQIVRREWFFDFYAPRLYAMVVGQVPIMSAIILGVTDLHWLARLLSFGLFALPTALYHMALWRVRDDPVLMAAVIAPYAVVFMTTSFFIVGEYNTSYAIAVLVAVRLATAERLTIGDSLVLALIGALAMRTYESMIYLGPLLAAMILWKLRGVPSRPLVPTLLHLLAAGFFLYGMWVAIDSVRHPFSEAHLEETVRTARNFWQNMQFDLAFAAALVVVLWGLVRPADLATARPYRWAAVCLVLLALSPLLALGDTLLRPFAKSQYLARTVAGLVVVAVVLFIWAYTARPRRTHEALLVLRTPRAAWRFLTFAWLMLVATVPSDIFLTGTWVSYLDAVRSTVTSRPGLVAIEDTPLSSRPHDLLVESWVLPSQALALRSRPGDGIVQPPRDFERWVPFPPLEPPNMGRFVWHD